MTNPIRETKENKVKKG